jgi:NAD(P)-dependent dehydrogenase (short-subunit alcohol dehydrogenase family)
VGHQRCRDVESGRCRGAGPAATARAVVGLVLGWGVDLRARGVSATAVSAGSTRVPMLSATAALADLECPEKLSARQLVERQLEPGEVAATICWLCCAQSWAMTGSVLHTAGVGTT